MTNDELVKAYRKMLESLNTAVKEAGGMPLTMEYLSTISAEQLLSLLCTNSIVFKYEPTND